MRKREQADLLKCKRFVHNLVPRDIRLRTDWHCQALSYLENCDLVFLDPDNGLNVKSVKAGSQKSPKYVWINEITDYVAAGKSVIFYNHRPRKKADTYFAEYFARFAAEPVLSEKTVYALTFPRRSVRDYFVIPATPAHEEKICAALHVLEAGEFGKSGFLFSVSRVSGSALRCESVRTDSLLAETAALYSFHFIEIHFLS